MPLHGYVGECIASSKLILESSRFLLRRPCHNAVHHVATNEELARRFYTMQLLFEWDDLQRWRQYAAKQRFGVKRG